MGPRDKNPPAGEDPGKKRQGSTPAERDKQYDETVADSFPASDPPPSPSIVGPPSKPERQPSGKR